MPGFAVRPTDISARVIANDLKDELGLAVVVDNVPAHETQETSTNSTTPEWSRPEAVHLNKT